MDILISILATDHPIECQVPGNVPDTGATGLLLGLAVIALGAIAKFAKNRKN